MATIKDIAREAGVAQGTVSNVINKTGKVSIEKIRLVEEAMAKLGYVPNAQASRLRQGSSDSVAVIIPTLKEEGYRNFYTAVQEILLASGYETLLYTTNDAAATEASILNKARMTGIAAVLAISTLSEICLELYNKFPCPVIYAERCPDKMREEDAFYGFDIAAIEQDWIHILSQSEWKKAAIFCPSCHSVLSPSFFDRLKSEADCKGMELVRFSADANLALPKAFDIVQLEPQFDAIISVGSACTDSILTVFSVCKMSRHPKLLSIGAASSYHSKSYETYEVDFSLLGLTAVKDLLARLTENAALPPNTVLPPAGFPFQFSEISMGSPETISIFTIEAPSTSALRKLLPMFESISGINVELICTTYEELHAQIKQLDQACPYDLIRMDVAELNTLGRELYLPLTQVIEPHHLSERLYTGIFKRYSTLDETIYALPFDPSVQLFLYRSDLFSDALLCRAYYETYREKLTAPTTVEQYLRVARFFTKAYNPDSPTEYGTTVTCGTDVVTASDFLPYFLGNGGKIIEGTTLQPLNAPEMLLAMEQYKEMQNYACKQKWWRDSLRQFISGKTATAMVYSNYVADVINTKRSNVVGQVGTAVAPGGHPLLGGGVVGVSRFSQKLEACRQFLTWYYSADISSMLVRLGGTSPLINAYRDFENFSIFPWLSTVEESTAIGTRGTNGVSVPGFTIRRYEFAIGTAVQKLIQEDVSPEHAAVIAQTLYDYR